MLAKADMGRYAAPLAPAARMECVGHRRGVLRSVDDERGLTEEQMERLERGDRDR